jgi:two-component system, OmpR family, sensor histidine kinase TctE
VASLERRLLVWVVAPLLVVGAVAAASAYVFIHQRLTSAFDQDLSDIAAALVPHLSAIDGRITLQFPAEADEVLRTDRADRIYYSVTTPEGAWVAGDRGLPRPPTHSDGGPVFYDAMHRGSRVRAVALEPTVDGVPVVVISVETTKKRDSAALETLAASVLPVLALLIAALTAVVLGVRRALRPVERLRAEIQSRSPIDLRPVDEGLAVEELKPLVRELNQMLARLDDAQRTQARFVANAAHQLRTPVAALVNQLDLADENARPGDAHVANAREAAGRIARLMQQLLSLAAADPSSNPSAAQERFDLSETVRARASEWLRLANARGADLAFDLGPAPVVGNPLLAGELATNLVDNAVRYGARQVSIAARLVGDRALLEVTDDGPGIPAADRERVFERFYRVNGTRAEGSGLGLAIVREIADRHGATVHMGEGPEGQGTRVGVLFRAT